MLVNAAAAISYIAAFQKTLQLFSVFQFADYLYPETTFIYGKTYDYIIVGGGTAGCVIANRLVEDGRKSVLLIEAGGNPPRASYDPSLLLYLKETPYTWNYTIEETGLSRLYQRRLKDQMSLGRVLGGSSSVSYLLYNPGNHYDYNSWADIVNDPTWKWENVQPYFYKSQRLEDRHLANTENGKRFGKKGNVGLSQNRYKIAEEFFPAFEQMGEKRVESFNGDVSVGVADALFTMANGIRQSTAYAYLPPVRNKPNLDVLKNTVVKRIILDCNKNAVGVEVQTEDKRDVFIKSRIEVVLSAGVVNSPKVLMLSGIGPDGHLNKHGINAVVDLPVGKNFKDAMLTVVVHNMTNMLGPVRPWNPNKYPASAIVSSTAFDNTGDRPDYQTANFIDYPKYCILYCVFLYGFTEKVCNNMFETDTNSYMLFSVITKQKSKSKGVVALRSGDFRDHPLVYPNYYTNEEDVDEHARACEDFTKIEKTPQFKKLGAVFQDPGLESCKKFERNSREYWKCYVKCMLSSFHYYTGTCAMGAVVDSRLRVFGVNRLRVADASVMPYPTAGGTLAATIMIGEKVSDMIKEDSKIVCQY